MKRTQRIRFKVAAHALFAVLRALELEAATTPDYHYEYGVTKDDDDLIVWCTREEIPKDQDPQNEETDRIIG